METRITVNGVKYRSVDEMPPDVREEYDRMMSWLADRNGDGVPDVLEGGQNDNSSVTQNLELLGSVSRVCHIDSNGKKLDRLEDLPPDLREMVDRARSQGGGAKTTVIESRTISPSIPVAREIKGDAIIIRLSWSTLFAILSVVGLAILVYWLTR